MFKFKEWFNENYGGSVNDPSNVEDEGEGGDGVEKKMEKPGAFPSYGDDLPITNKNRSKKIVGRFSKKK